MSKVERRVKKSRNPRTILKTLTIDRSKWLRGNAGEASVLYSEKTGRQCCLGFVARRCGLKVDDIRNRFTPKYSKKPHLWPRLFLDVFEPTGSNVDTPLTSSAMVLNDDRSLSGREREKGLKALFAGAGIKVKFVGRSPRAKKTRSSK